MSRFKTVFDGDIELSVVIPMFNEAARIVRTLKDVTRSLAVGQRTAELILVDDGSVDTTADAVRPWLKELPDGNLRRVRLVRHDRNRGKGAAVRTGLGEAVGRWRLMMDADSSVRIGEVERLWQKIEGSVAMVCGSRNAPGALVEARAFRRLAGMLFQLGLLGLGLRLLCDTQCGFKLYRADVAEAVVREGIEDHLAFDLEHLLIAKRRGELVEVGVRWVHCDGGSVRPVRDGLRMLVAAARLRWRSLRRQRPANAPNGVPALAGSQVEIKQRAPVRPSSADLEPAGREMMVGHAEYRTQPGRG